MLWHCLLLHCTVKFDAVYPLESRHPLVHRLLAVIPLSQQCPPVSTPVTTPVLVDDTNNSIPGCHPADAGDFSQCHCFGAQHWLDCRRCNARYVALQFLKVELRCIHMFLEPLGSVWIVNTETKTCYEWEQRSAPNQPPRNMPVDCGRERGQLSDWSLSVTMLVSTRRQNVASPFSISFSES